MPGLGCSSCFSASLCFVYNTWDVVQNAAMKYYMSLFSSSGKVTVQSWRWYLKFQPCLDKVLTTLSWRDWEMNASEILIGIHSPLCYFPRKILGAVALFLEMRIWNCVSWYKILSLIFCSDNFMFLFVASSSSEDPNERLTSSLLAIGHGLHLLALV